MPGLFGVFYAIVGVAFPNPPAADPAQFAWRLSAWMLCAVAFASHIALEHRRRLPPVRVAARVSVGVAIGACALAIAANAHAASAGTGNRRLLALAIVLWPILVGVPAFIAAWGIAAILARLRSTPQVRA